MTGKRSILAGLVTAVAAAMAASPVLAAPAHYPISTEQVAAALAGMGMPVAPAQIVMVSGIVANTPNPQLRIDSIQRWGTRVMVRLQCESQDQCLPFFVNLRLNPGDQHPVLTSPAQAAVPQPAAKPAPQFRMRVGSPATLLLDGPHMQIRVSVICLDGGATGETIRATDPDHRQVYTAQVVADGLLKGRL